MAVEPPKIAEAKCSYRKMLRPEESKKPSYRYSLRPASVAAAEKEPNATEVPTKAVTKILEGRDKRFQAFPCSSPTSYKELM